MRFATFTHENSTGPGLVLEGQIVDLGDLYPTLLGLIEAGADGLEAARSRLADGSGRRLGEKNTEECPLKNHASIGINGMGATLTTKCHRYLHAGLTSLKMHSSFQNLRKHLNT